jgi:pimeloyl-ACP methyl ester carboxylesterase
MNGTLRAVVLPGSGSDEVFVRSAFAGPLRLLGIDLVAPAVLPGPGVVEGYRAALDAAYAEAPGGLLVGGISLGAHVAAGWAAQRPRARLAGLLLALPAWTGPPDGAPAALAARATAALARAEGVTGALDAARAGSPPWLAAELTRAWRRYGADLATSLEAAAATPAPDTAALRSLTAPTGIAALAGDPVHPVAEARRWRDLLPRAGLVTSTLEAFGTDPEVLGRAALLGWLQAAGQPRRR